MDLPHTNIGKSVWKQTGSGTATLSEHKIHIQNNLPGAQKVFQQVKIDAPTFLRLSFEATSDKLETDAEKYWHGASAAIKSKTKDNKVVKVSYIALLYEPSQTTAYSEVELFEEHIDSVEVTFQLLKSTGNFQVKNPVLSSVHESARYQYWKKISIGLWICIGLSLAILAVMYLPLYHIMTVAALLLLLFLGTLLPEATINSLNNKLSTVIPVGFQSHLKDLLKGPFGVENLTTTASYISKFGHILVFFLIGLFAGIKSKKVGVAFAAAAIGVFALLSETLQLLVSGRSTSMQDVYLDLFGGIFGLMIGILLLLGSHAIVKGFLAVYHRVVN